MTEVVHYCTYSTSPLNYVIDQYLHVAGVPRPGSRRSYRHLLYSTPHWSCPVPRYPYVGAITAT